MTAFAYAPGGPMRGEVSRTGVLGSSRSVRSLMRRVSAENAVSSFAAQHAQQVRTRVSTDSAEVLGRE